METSENVEKLVEMLKEGVFTVEFRKINGETRVMTCTLDKNVIPAPSKDPLTQTKVRKISENTVVAWDVAKNDWRSFRKDSVISFKLAT